MARLPFPDTGSRLTLTPEGRPALSKTGTVYTDSAGTTLADIVADSDGTPGAALAGSQVVTDAYGMLPIFWGPDTSPQTDRLHISVNGGPIWPVDADYNARLDGLVIDSVNTVAAAGTTLILPDPAMATMNVVTLTASTCTLTFPTAGAGKAFSLVLYQGTPGSRTITWPAGIKWPYDIAPTLATTTGAVDEISIRHDGVAWRGSHDATYPS